MQRPRECSAASTSSLRCAQQKLPGERLLLNAGRAPDPSGHAARRQLSLFVRRPSRLRGAGHAIGRRCEVLEAARDRALLDRGKALRACLPRAALLGSRLLAGLLELQTTSVV